MKKSLVVKHAKPGRNTRFFGLKYGFAYQEPAAYCSMGLSGLLRMNRIWSQVL